MTPRVARPVMVDDTDRDIRYIGEWSQDTRYTLEAEDLGPPYMDTLHTMKTNGGIAYTFQGTSFGVFGGLNEWKTLPSWECFVDNTSLGAAQPAMGFGNSLVLCQRQDLLDGQHEIVVNFTMSGNTFWLDFIQYTPSPSLSLETAVMVIENDDPAIVFDSDWQSYVGMTSLTSSTGSTMTLQFTGTSVSWVGLAVSVPDFRNSSATYLVDGGSPISFPLHALNGTSFGDTLILNQMLFTTPERPAGSHTLIVVYNGDRLQAPLTLDYLYVTNTSIPINSSTSNSTTTTTMPPSTLMPTTNQPAGKHSQAGKIAGGVVSGVVLLSLALFLLWRYRRRSQHIKQPPGASNVRTPSQLAVLPFTSHFTSRAGHRNILINPSSQDGLGPQMQRGAVTKPLHPLQSPLISATTTVGPQMQSGPVTKLSYPSSPPLLITDQTPPSPVGASQHAPSVGPPLIPELQVPVVNTISQTTPMTQLRDQENVEVVHEDSGLRFGGTVLRDTPPTYTET